MRTVASDERELSSVAQALLSTVSELVSDADKRVYAVMDGAQFNDLPSLLKHINVSHRPLYRHAGGDYSVILGGPWLIDPYQPAMPRQDGEPLFDHDGADMSDEELAQRSAALSERMVSSLNGGDLTGGGMLPVNEADPSTVISRLRNLVQLNDGKPALVFWCGDEKLSAEELYRHLRGLNRILVPRVWRDSPASVDGPRVTNEVEFAAAGDGSSSENEQAASGELVIFRHADANVMMQTIPALNEIQVARLFGPTSSIIFAPDEAWGGGVKRARRGSDLVSHRGFLTLDRDAMAAMSASRLEVSRKRVMAYLRDTDPENNNLSDAELRKKVVFYEAHGQELGLRSERAHGQWAFLMSSSNGAIGDEHEITSALRSSRDADQTLDQIMDAMVKIGQAELSGKRVLGSA
ncbi:DUF4123 domain-containing protein [Agrobacterium larrymoorei]|uniref:hypothetical protein n=1 Tax=Agrobacterium larrymoorei TaxID=160699 RepID=UPI001574760D|nr:hypothetical protein [Agrobacterium larrymoorei]NTJ44616.1 DUF4123 domain-containing protein [Agrobacterium larrymoorei]